MNLRMKNKLVKNILNKYYSNGQSFEKLRLSAPEKRLLASGMERARQKILLTERGKRMGRKEGRKETWEERIERIDSYKFDNPTPIKIHRQRSMWDKIKDKIKSWGKYR